MEAELYSVLIADDEPLVRKGLRKILPWEELGFTVCGEAADGQSALAFLLRHHPCIVLLDIQMPGLYGTELMQRARAGGYTGDFIVLSGYSDFQYAQSAIRSGAVSYLTKPVDEDELQAVLAQIRAKLDAARQSAQSLNQYLQKARQAVLTDLLLGKTDTAAMPEVPPGGFQVVLCSAFVPFRPSKEIGGLLRGSVGQEYPAEQLTLDDTEVYVLLGGASIEHFARLCTRWRSGAERPAAIEKAFLVSGPAVKQPDELAQSYREARSLLAHRFFCAPDQHILLPDDLPHTAQPAALLTPEKAHSCCERFVDYLQTFQRRNVQEELDRLRAQLRTCGADIPEIRHYLADILLQVKQYMAQAYRSLSLPLPDNATILQTVENKPSLDEILQYYSEQFELILRAIGTNSSDSILDDVLFYIDHNYAQPLKLESIARLYSYNSSYLGRIFNQHTKQSFNAYLDTVRVRAAQELLRTTDLKVYEIAARVGYANVDYFHQKFRRIAGCSPAEYRRQT